MLILKTASLSASLCLTQPTTATTLKDSARTEKFGRQQGNEGFEERYERSDDFSLRPGRTQTPNKTWSPR